MENTKDLVSGAPASPGEGAARRGQDPRQRSGRWEERASCRAPRHLLRPGPRVSGQRLFPPLRREGPKRGGVEKKLGHPPPRLGSLSAPPLFFFFEKKSFALPGFLSVGSVLVVAWVQHFNPFSGFAQR